jgi:transcriptional regulator with GAF, ATPase, and Fis domain
MNTEAKVPTNGTLIAALERTKREAVEKVLAQAKGNTAEAAARLGILRTSLYRIMNRYGIACPSRAGSQLIAPDAGAAACRREKTGRTTQ